MVYVTPIKQQTVKVTTLLTNKPAKLIINILFPEMNG